MQNNTSRDVTSVILLINRLDIYIFKARLTDLYGLYLAFQHLTSWLISLWLQHTKPQLNKFSDDSVIWNGFLFQNMPYLICAVYPSLSFIKILGGGG